MRGILITLTLFALALPAAAGAQVVQPGNSGVDQYQESIPGAGGNRLTGPNASGTGKVSGAGSKASGTGNASGTDAVPGESRVSPRAAQSLDKLGPDGKAAAATAAATAPSHSLSPGESDSFNSGPGMGWVLPVILTLALAGALTLAVLRRRRGTPPGAA